MKTIKGIGLVICCWLSGYGTKVAAQKATLPDSLQQTERSMSHWYKGLTEMGIEKNKDSFLVREEVVKLLKDPAYRQTVYRPYSWTSINTLLQRMELRKAFWQMINLYQEDTASRRTLIGTVILYDSLIEMDKALLSSFYTYAFADPEICRLKNNKPEIFRPDLLEQKLRTTREIVSFIWRYREKKQGAGKP